MAYKIYGLVSSKDIDNIRYIGYTKNSIKKRLSQHLLESKSGKSKKNCWIRGVLKNEFSLNIILLEDNVESFEEINNKEIFYIKHYKNLGNNLVNGTNGGMEIPENYVKGATKAKLKKISQYNLFGEKLNDFNCINDAAEYLQISASAISKCLKGKQLVKKEYLFEYYGNPPRTIREFKEGKKNIIPFIVIDRNGVTVDRFVSLKSASRKLKISESSFKRCLLSGNFYKNIYKFNYI